jgi:hypothetical protein
VARIPLRGGLLSTSYPISTTEMISIATRSWRSEIEEEANNEFEAPHPAVI